MSGGPFADLRRLLGGYAPGAWFRGVDLLGGKAEKRPWLMPCGWDMGPTALAFPRSTQTGGREFGWNHPAHEPGHQDGCCIDKPGRVVMRSWTLRADELDRYCCDEPDEQLVELVRSKVRCP